MPDAYRGQKRMFDPCILCYRQVIWILGNEPWSSARAVSALLNHLSSPVVFNLWVKTPWGWGGRDE